MIAGSEVMSFTEPGRDLLDNVESDGKPCGQKARPGHRTCGHHCERLKPFRISENQGPRWSRLESHPYLPETELLEFCRGKGIVFLAFAPLVTDEGRAARRYVISAIATRVGKTRHKCCWMGSTARDGFGYTAAKCGPGEREF